MQAYILSTRLENNAAVSLAYQNRVFQIQRMKHKAHRTGARKTITGEDTLALLEPY